ncbi:hypothetical protein, partial [Listeria monocytogenes]|uniref:hypothetical protein n=1 Tax=Listeria monocytogenes TaxID=1639 RepID=UPI003FA46068
LTVGTGKDVVEGMRFDGALEYTFSSADVGSGFAAGDTGLGKDTRNGTYSVNAYVAHLGMTYTF